MDLTAPEVGRYLDDLVPPRPADWTVSLAPIRDGLIVAYRSRS